MIKGLSNPQCTGTKEQSNKIYKAATDRNESRDFNFSASLSVTDKSPTENQQDVNELNTTIKSQDISNIFKTPTQKQWTTRFL